MADIQLYNGDCLEIMQQLIEQGVKVDAVITDPPYGTTKCQWDSIIPFDKMWGLLKQIRKDESPILLFGNEPFNSYLRISNVDEYRYDIYWQKERATNIFQLKKRPAKVIETINVFYKKQCTYNPQMVKYNGKKVTNKPSETNAKFKSIVASNSPTMQIKPYKDIGYRYPCDILNIRREKLGSTVHPTQKPVALLEYLIKTYTNENETVLDNCMGSGTTGVACKKLNRRFIGMEKDEKYFNIAKERIENESI